VVAAVSRGHVGIVLADEARRRAHNHAEWSELRDRAALVGALSAVAEAVYDPRTYNDRLLLGQRNPTTHRTPIVHIAGPCSR
jgi:hypothetical protein